MRSIIAGLLLATVAALAGCASSVPLQRAQVGGLTRDSSADEVDRLLGQATRVAQFEFETSGKSFLARHYNLQTGVRQDMTMVCTPACIPIVITVPVTAQYVVIQRLPSKALHAWGTLEELSKDSDESVSGLMPTVKQRFEEARQKK